MQSRPEQNLRFAEALSHVGEDSRHGTADFHGPSNADKMSLKAFTAANRETPQASRITTRNRRDVQAVQTLLQAH